MILATAVEAPPEALAPARARSIGPIALADVVGLVVSCLLVVAAFSPVLFLGHTLSGASKTYGTNGSAPFPGGPERDIFDDTRAHLGASTWQAEPWAGGHASQLCPMGRSRSGIPTKEPARP